MPQYGLTWEAKMPWMVFIVSAIVIVVAGTKLSRYGDAIAEYSGLGRLWIGSVLLAGATSLPEVFTATSATLIDEPDIAVGDLLGACLNNMLILAILDLVYRRKHVWQQTAMEHMLVASLALILTGLSALLITIQQTIVVWQIGVGSFSLAVIYGLGMRAVYRYENLRHHKQELERVVEAGAISSDRRGTAGALRRALVGFGVAGMGILVAAPLLAESAKEIAEISGLSKAFIGTTLVAIATSLPELVTSLAAVRISAFDLAVGNLFGSNAFNIAALFVADIAYRKGALLVAVGSVHAVTALLSMLLMSVGVMGIIYRAEKRFVLIEPDSYLLIFAYILGIGLLLHLS